MQRPVRHRNVGALIEETQHLPHDLRHLANTMAAKVPGTTLKDLTARLEQSSPQAALRYLHRTAQAARAMAQGIDDEL